MLWPTTGVHSFSYNIYNIIMSTKSDGDEDDVDVDVKSNGGSESANDDRELMRQELLQYLQSTKVTYYLLAFDDIKIFTVTLMSIIIILTVLLQG